MPEYDLAARGGTIATASDSYRADIGLYLFNVTMPFTMHPVGLLDAVVVFGRRQQPDHVGSSENEGLAVGPVFHGVLLCAAPHVATHRSKSNRYTSMGHEGLTRRIDFLLKGSG